MGHFRNLTFADVEILFQQDWFSSCKATTSKGGIGAMAGGPGPSIGRTLSEQILAGAANAKRHSPQSSSASSEGNDDAAMAVIMSLLEVNTNQRLIGSKMLTFNFHSG